ncbi:hypothetical protein C3B44_02375 [Corynebacterium yudongzhengii]|uniref:Uncharacterized protein n=1 Tax=Corynebacterium yudongzhengii TaxID=2080740 RepID=A0A2U1T6Z4_9CORY|nr:hypothetical protein [Corynebacterium yudongzhengii]AWB81337.1 hypothetical protein C3B44_02375 [Corynebacterium yudongzhengii]PWC01780.1 hypothetical protein DF222_05460 [Corynebacterium yudongzhengii]
MLFLKEVNLVRHSHFLEQKHQGILFSLLRAFFLITPLSVMGAPAALGQAGTSLAIWAGVLLVSTPAAVSLSPALRVPIIPIGTLPRIVGAALGFRFLELMPAAGLVVYRLIMGTLPDKTLVILIIAGLAMAFGLVRVLVDDLSLRWPHIFYRSHLVTITLLPGLFGAVTVLVGLGLPQNTTVGTVTILSLFPLYFSFISERGPIVMTIGVPGLTSRMFRRTSVYAIACAAVGSFIGLLFFQIPPLLALAQALGVAATAGLWLACAWGGGVVRGFILLVLSGLFIGAPAGIVNAEQSLRSTAAVALLSVLIAAAAWFGLRRVRDQRLTTLLSG